MKAFEESKKAGSRGNNNAQYDNQVNKWEENLKKQRERQNNGGGTEFDNKADMGAWGQWYNPRKS